MATFDINDTNRRVQYTTNGSQTAFAFSFQINAASELKVILGEATQTLSDDYTVSISTDNGSTSRAIASTISVPADSTLSLLSTTVYLDETDILKIQGSANSDLEYTVSGEILDDA